MTTRSYPTKVWRSTGDDAREVDAIAYTTAIDQIATYDRDNRPVDGSDGVLAGTARKAIDEGIRLWREANP